MATDACNAGHVKIGGSSVKPSRDIHVGEEVSVLAGRVQRTVRVLGLLEQRVGAKIVCHFLEDLTPPEEFARARAESLHALVRFPKGFGRPTKKVRRQWEGLF